MEHNKLVRDRIPEIIESRWEIVETRILSDKEYIVELKKKILEEVKEYLDSEDPEELVDIIEVVYAIGKTHLLDEKWLEEVRLKKKAKRWWFQNKIFLIETR